MKFKNPELEKAIKLFGSVYRLSQLLNVSMAALYQWQRVPPLRAYEIEKLSKGKIKASRLLKGNP